ncbi:TRAP transporter small permease [Salinisphaera sp. T31B1]|uniref:TRAP transporter small permease n=1 Tax=Salinisphaera sp. T31B1 TaxID=727963 RepID=UPI0033400998
MIAARWVDRLEEGLAALVLAAMVTLAFANVLTRYLLHYPLAASHEIIVNAFVWLTLIGIAIGLREGGEGAHIRFVAATEFLPEPLRRGAVVFGFVVTAGLFAVLAWLSYYQLADDLLLGMTSPALGWPNWMYTGPTPVLSAWVAVRALLGAAAVWRRG